MAVAVYILCTLTALLCAVMLARGYASTRSRLLLWSSLCFVGLTINNALVFVDLVVFPEISLFTIRSAAGLLAVVVLLFGLIYETRGVR